MLRRLLDLTFGLFWLIITAPLMLLIGLLIKLDSPGPALYVPAMVGYRGRVFRLYRFRNMRADWRSQSPERQRTAFGRFIRNYSLDHLPLLLNLLKGDLTLVGPRPQEAEVVDLADPVWQAYFGVKPGLINYAVLRMGNTYGSCRARNMDLKRELELEYIRQRSPAHDLRLSLWGLRALLTSRLNPKARLEPDPALRERLANHGPDGDKSCTAS